MVHRMLILLTSKEKHCLIIDERSHSGGNVYGEINVQKYGAHIFHTSNKGVWNFVNSINVYRVILRN